jgi:hypothetical protein
MDTLALKARVTGYFLDRDPFIVRAKHPFALFLSGINKYSSRVRESGPATDWYGHPPPFCASRDACLARATRERLHAMGQLRDARDEGRS